MKKIFFLLIFFISLGFSYANEIKPVSLPLYPELKKENLRELLISPKKKKSSLSWLLERHQGIQMIRQVSKINVTDHDEQIFPLNNYKATSLTINVFDLFLLYSNMTIGFLQGTAPFDFSFSTLPYEKDWVSFESYFYVSHSFSLFKRYTVSPVVGYLFSQYFLSGNVLSKNEVRYFNSIFIGSKISFKPARIVDIDFKIDFAPLIFQNYTKMPVYQASIESSIAVKAGILSIAGVVNTTNNIEYGDNSDTLQIFKVSEFGIRFNLTF